MTTPFTIEDYLAAVDASGWGLNYVDRFYVYRSKWDRTRAPIPKMPNIPLYIADLKHNGIELVPTVIMVQHRSGQRFIYRVPEGKGKPMNPKEIIPITNEEIKQATSDARESNPMAGSMYKIVISSAQLEKYKERPFDIHLKLSVGEYGFNGEKAYDDEIIVCFHNGRTYTWTRPEEKKIPKLASHPKVDEKVVDYFRRAALAAQTGHSRWPMRYFVVNKKQLELLGEANLAAIRGQLMEVNEAGTDKLDDNEIGVRFSDINQSLFRWQIPEEKKKEEKKKEKPESSAKLQYTHVVALRYMDEPDLIIRPPVGEGWKKGLILKCVWPPEFAVAFEDGVIKTQTIRGNTGKIEITHPEGLAFLNERRLKDLVELSTMQVLWVQGYVRVVDTPKREYYTNQRGERCGSCIADNPEVKLLGTWPGSKSP